MNKLNWLFTFASINVLLITIERFSFTTKILLQPYGFLRLHELLQMTTLILFTVLIPFFILREISSNFEVFKTKNGFTLAVLFLIGVYFYATGNGIHELSSFNFNNFCDTKNFSGDLCGSMFFNDYYTGNIFYFVGGILMNLSLLLIEKINTGKKTDNKNLIITLINSGFYALAIFAYAAFDRVLVGLVYSVVLTLIAALIFLGVRNKYRNYQLITYTTATYALGTIPALLFRLF